MKFLLTTLLLCTTIAISIAQTYSFKSNTTLYFKESTLIDSQTSNNSFYFSEDSVYINNKAFGGYKLHHLEQEKTGVARVIIIRKGYDDHEMWVLRFDKKELSAIIRFRQPTCNKGMMYVKLGDIKKAEFQMIKIF
jgi:hypothetical protein